MRTAIDVIADLVAYSAIIPITLLIYFYGTRPTKGSVWRRRFSRLWTTTQVGKTLMLQMVAWFVYLVFVTASIVWHDWLGRDVLRLAIYAVLVGLFWAFFFALRRLQKQKLMEHNQLGVNLDTDVERTQPPHTSRKVNKNEH
jgi:hypothetical protein